MHINYHAHQTPQFRVLSDSQIVKLFQATLECLQRTGVHILNAEARELMAGAGARVEGVRVYIPPHIIQDAIHSNPRSFTLWDRPLPGQAGVTCDPSKYSGTRDERPVPTPKRAPARPLQIVPDRVYFGPGPTCTCFSDPWTGERRQTRRGDPALTARVCDALDNIDYVMSLGLIDDVTPSLASVYEFAEMVSNTTKPVLAWAYTPDNVIDITQIAIAAAGGEEVLRRRPFFAFFSTFASPLVQADEDLANSMWAAEHGIPVIFVGGGTAGLTSPVTGAGTLVITLAGALTSLAVMQLKARGAPVCIGGVPMAMDLRTSRVAYGSPEMSLYSAAMADVARYLGLPFMGTAGASEAKVLDLQAAIESTLQVVLSGLSGATLVHDVGFLDCAELGSLEMLVMNDEIIGMTRRIMRGIENSDDTLMLDLIDRIGPGGEFVSAVETARRCRAEIWRPSLMDRNAWVNWQAAGALTMQDRIRLRLREILDAPCAVPLPEAAPAQIEAVLAAAEARAAKTR